MWPEGALYIWTGHHTASGQAVAYCQNINVSKQYGVAWQVSLSGTYKRHTTGQQMDVSVNAAYTHNSVLRTLAEAQTAVHFKFLFTGIHGSAGEFGYSGSIDNLTLQGAEGGAFVYSLRAQSHEWSAF